MRKIIVPFLQKNGKIINRLFWSDDGLNWYWVGSRNLMFKIICHVMAYSLKKKPARLLVIA